MTLIYVNIDIFTVRGRIDHNHLVQPNNKNNRIHIFFHSHFQTFSQTFGFIGIEWLNDIVQIEYFAVALPE